ncbi:hypothetical protein HPB50_029568 [Hyalomma asiaticum]|nr:hypothetical protein HPB50_029568 [Hyalomma asiaticum]
MKSFKVKVKEVNPHIMDVDGNPVVSSLWDGDWCACAQCTPCRVSPSFIKARSQLTNENVAIYVKDMSRLFGRADPNMTEDKKLHHLMRGVKQELFAVLVLNSLCTVTEFWLEATAIEKMLEQSARQYSHDWQGSYQCKLVVLKVRSRCHISKKVNKHKLQRNVNQTVKTANQRQLDLSHHEQFTQVFTPNIFPIGLHCPSGFHCNHRGRRFH